MHRFIKINVILPSTQKVCADCHHHDPPKKLKNSPTLRFSFALYVGSVVVVVTEQKFPTSKLNNPSRLKVMMMLDFSRGQIRALFHLFIHSHAKTLCRLRLGNSSWRHGGQRTRHLPQSPCYLSLASSKLTTKGKCMYCTCWVKNTNTAPTALSVLWLPRCHITHMMARRLNPHSQLNLDIIKWQLGWITETAQIPQLQSLQTTFIEEQVKSTIYKKIQNLAHISLIR